MIEQKFVERIAQEISARPEQVGAAIRLLDKGATVPFIARYRKDATGNLSDEALERVEARNLYFTALTNRRNAVLDNIAKLGQLTDDLRERIEGCFDQTTLEDLYLPYKKQRRTKATVAREKGLEPLADFLWAQADGVLPLLVEAEKYCVPGKSVFSPEEALEGARHILAERLSLNADIRSALRHVMLEDGKITAAATKNAQDQKTKFEAYYHFSEPVKTIPSHRLLAVLRGVRLGFLRMDLNIDDAAVLERMLSGIIRDRASHYAADLTMVIEDAYKRLLRPSIENEVIQIVREAADAEAVHVFRENTRNLLMAPPAGRIAVIGVDPGQRSGCKLAVISDTGAYLDSAVIYPAEPQNDVEGAEATLRALMEKHQVHAIAIGNGTGAREVARFIGGVLKRIGSAGNFCVFVSEAGASVYSASKVARQEFPDLDVTVRGAISIARRLQDPLAELVKLEPRSIGVGQYQHDINQRTLREGLYKTVESCVNQVGVDLNTTSVDLLRYVSGIQIGTAQNIVEHRTKIGGFTSRAQLMEVSGIGEKTFEQCAGFLRIPGAVNPLDATSIHPEAYPVVERIAESVGQPVTALIANPELIRGARFDEFATEVVGPLALADIHQELLKPGRDPRAEFKVPRFLDGVLSVDDLQEGMETEGVVTNVTDFGAFVDIGVHQDGLVHLSELANRFVRDPREIVKVGEIVRVKVIKIDRELKRVSLSMKALIPAPAPRPQRPPRRDAEAAAAAENGGSRPERGPRPEPGPRPERQREPRGEEPRRAPRPGPSREAGRTAAEAGSRGEGSERPHPKKGKRPQQQRSREAHTPAPQGEHFNTVLADQLAALKAKFNS